MEQSVHETLGKVEEIHWWWRARREIIADAIARYAPVRPEGRLRLAEIGCGSGGNLGMLAQFGSVIGAEADPATYEQLRRSRGDSHDVVLHRIPEDLPGRFHVIGMFDVLEHVSDDVGALRWAWEHLEPGGILVLTVPAFQFLWSQLDVAAHHLRRYTASSLAAVVPDTLTIEHCSCFNSLLFPLILAARTAMRVIPSASQPSRSQLDVPPEPLNWLLYRVFRLERQIVVRNRLPLGVSLLLIARRPLAPA